VLSQVLESSGVGQHIQHRQARLCGSQDTIRFWPLAVTMLGMSFRDPLVVSRVVRQVNTFLDIPLPLHPLRLPLCRHIARRACGARQHLQPASSCLGTCHLR